MLKSYAEYAPVFKAMSDETRLKIIDILCCGEVCACDILSGLTISQSTLSYHMKMLTEAGIVNGRKEGQWMRYTLNKKRIDEVVEFLNFISTEREDCICKTMKKADCDCDDDGCCCH